MTRYAESYQRAFEACEITFNTDGHTEPWTVRFNNMPRNTRPWEVWQFENSCGWAFRTEAEAEAKAADLNDELARSLAF